MAHVPWLEDRRQPKAAVRIYKQRIASYDTVRVACCLSYGWRCVQF